MIVRTLGVWLLLLVSALAGTPSAPAPKEVRDLIFTEQKDADCTVVIHYEVPGVIRDTETYYFRRLVVEDLKGAPGEEVLTIINTEFQLKNRCGGGQGGCDGTANIALEDAGFEITLDLNWTGQKTGSLSRKMLVPWSELEKTSTDLNSKIAVTVQWRQP